MTMLELLEESPIIAAVKSQEGLEHSLKSECKVVFVLFGTICDIDAIVAKIKAAGKIAIVHVDMIQGLSTKKVAVDFIAHNTKGGWNHQHEERACGIREGDWSVCDSENLCGGFHRLKYPEKTDRAVPPGRGRDHAGCNAEDLKDHAGVYRYSSDCRRASV